MLPYISVSTIVVQTYLNKLLSRQSVAVVGAEVTPGENGQRI